MIAGKTQDASIVQNLWNNTEEVLSVSGGCCSVYGVWGGIDWGRKGWCGDENIRKTAFFHGQKQAPHCLMGGRGCQGICKQKKNKTLCKEKGSHCNRIIVKLFICILCYCRGSKNAGRMVPESLDTSVLEKSWPSLKCWFPFPAGLLISMDLICLCEINLSKCFFN